MEARLEALIEGVLLVLLDFRHTQVGFNLMSVQVWGRHMGLNLIDLSLHVQATCCLQLVSPPFNSPYVCLLLTVYSPFLLSLFHYDGIGFF